MKQKFLLAVLLLWSSISTASPTVVVSIAPVHSLIAGLMQGVGTPTLLTNSSICPHHHSLKTSERMTLDSADIVFWVGPTLESYLVSPLKTLSPQPRIITLSQMPERVEDDPHFWLDPQKAMLVVNQALKILVKADPKHQEEYQNNANRILKKLEALDNVIEQKLQPVQNQPFIVFHDAYQHFVRRYHLRQLGSLTVDPEIPPSIQRVDSILALIKTHSIGCVFIEPHTSSQWVGWLESKLCIRTLDPIGSSDSHSEEAYLTLLKNLSQEVYECLSKRQENH